MPPAYVRTHRDLVYYEWAKLASAAQDRRGDARFIMERVKTLKSTAARPDDVVAPASKCFYDGATTGLEADFLVPPSKGGLEIGTNLVPACEACRASKAQRDVLSWYKDRRTKVPKRVWQRYLSVVYDQWEKRGLLEAVANEAETKRLAAVDLDLA